MDAIKDPLAFSFEDKPNWRSNDTLSTNTMLQEIEWYQSRYKNLPKNAHEFCDKEFCSAMAVDYIYHLNVGELVGTQTKEDTKAVIDHLLQKRHSRDSETFDQGKTETLNTYLAMEKIHDEVKLEMKNTGMLTVQQICSVHKVLLSQLHANAGNIRKAEAYTLWETFIYYYPSAKRVEDLFYSVIDRHNIHMKCLDSVPESEKTAYIFKCAAWLLFNFVDTHPFSDGNGRMCRLLANYVVSLITPFPVSLYHNNRKETSERKDYVQAIVNCRDDPARQPKELAAMLVEGAWRGWKNLFAVLKSRNELEPCISIGPVVAQKSKQDDIKERVHRIWSKVGASLPKTEEEVIRLVQGDTSETDVSQLQGHQYIEKSIGLDVNTSLKVHVYK